MIKRYLKSQLSCGVASFGNTALLLGGVVQHVSERTELTRNLCRADANSIWHVYGDFRHSVLLQNSLPCGRAYRLRGRRVGLKIVLEQKTPDAWMPAANAPTVACGLCERKFPF